MKKEFLLIGAVAILIFSIFYKASSYSNFVKSLDEIRVQEEKIATIGELKKSWKNSKIKIRLDAIKKYLPKQSVKSFSKKKRKLKASFVKLNPKIYNKLIKDIWNLKVKIIKFKSKVVDEKYEVNLECSWQ